MPSLGEPLSNGYLEDGWFRVLRKTLSMRVRPPYPHGSRRRPWPRVAAATLLAMIVAGANAPSLLASPSAPFASDDGLTSFDLHLLGLSARPEPESQIVPRNTPTGLNIALDFGGSSADPAQMLALLPSGLEVAAELVGPGIDAPIQLRGAPGELLPIPPLVSRGMYLVRDIRLELSGEFLLRALPDSATIEVIERVLVTQVTTRPLDVEEIRQRGIIFGDDNFRGFNFTLALKLDSRPVQIDFPVVFDANNVLVSTRPTAGLNLQAMLGANPLLNAQIEPVMLTLHLPGDEELELPEDVAGISIPGLLVIPGDVGFLNQFFSAMLVVSNGAPLGSNLSVRDLEGTIRLPGGDDGVTGTVDDPLVVAETGSGHAFTVPIVGLGPDGVLGTGDDQESFLPGKQGQAEYLLEGRREGFHGIDFDITGTLDGLPVGPVEIHGRARGGVVVRNPFFSMTFSAPRTVRQFEDFTLFVNVTNTSAAVANLVNVTLNALQLSGAELLSSPTVSIDSLEPGDSETLRFRFRSMKTGEVTASYLNFEQDGQANEGDLLFTLGVGERGTPLSPDTLVLPTSVEALPASVLDQSLRVLGQAWSLATAPDGTVPEGVLRVSKQVVVDRALELAEAGLRVTLGESIPSALTSLAFTWLSAEDPGFDQILRETDAGEAFQTAIGSEIRTSDAITNFHEDFASRLTSLPPHLLVSVGSGTGAAPVTWEVIDVSGKGLRVEGDAGSQDLFTSSLENSGFLPLADPTVTGRGTALVTRLRSYVYEVRWRATGAGILDLSVNLPRAAGGSEVHAFSGISVETGDEGKVVLDLLSTESPLVMVIDADGDGVYEQSVDAGSEIVLQPSGPQLLSANAIGPETLSGADSYGRAAALLFDRELRMAEATVAENYSIEANEVLSAWTQLSGRLVFLFLEQPAGDLVEREVAVSGLFDATGRPMSTETRLLGSRLTPPDASGAVVSGRVLDAEGSPIAGAQVLYWNSAITNMGMGKVAIAQQFTDADGAYQFDWVRGVDVEAFTIQAADPATGGFQERSTTIRSHGERLVVDLVLRGRGGVTGVVSNLAGYPVPAARVLVTSEIDPASFALIEANGDGRYVATNVIVGPVSVKAVSGTSSGLASGNIQRAGTFTTVDVTINTGVGRVVSRALEIDGADVTTPVPLAPIYYLIPSGPGVELVVGSGETDENGLFVFEEVPTGPFRIAAFDLVRGLQASKTGELVVQGTDVIVNGCAGGECQVLFEEEAIGTLTGEVRLASGAPAAGARVTAGGLQVITQADGTFQIDSVAAGSHLVVAEFGPGRSASATVNVVTGTTANVSLALPGVGTVVVTVVGANGIPLAGQPVIRVLNGCSGIPQVTDASGVATFDDVPVPGGYFKSLRLTDIADGYAAIRHDGDQTSIALRFGGFATVTGIVVDASDQPVLGADVVLGAKVPNDEYCMFERQGRARQIKTGVDGLFQFGHVPVGLVNVSASSFFLPIPTGASGNLLADGEIRNFTLRLISNIAGELNGTVYLSDGTTPAGPDVLVTVSGGLPDVTVRTDAAGRYSFAKIFPAGRYALVAADPITGKVARQSIALQADQDLTTDLRLLGHGTVNVSVLDGGGNPIEDAFVELKGAQYPYFQAAGAITAQDGGAIRFLRVPEGRFTITASDNEGRGGRGMGTIVEDGATLNVTVSMTITGTVTGTYKTAEGTTPIPNAEVALRQGTGRLLGSTTTSSHPDTLGTFSFDYVPAGNVLVTAMDPITGRLGESSGVIETQDQVLNLEIRQLGAGRISGTVASGGSPIAAAEVRLSSTTGLSSAVPNLLAYATTDGAGTFVFDGVPVGSFQLRATVPGLLLVGTASGFIDTDGQQVEVEIDLAASGTLTGDIFHPDEITPAPAASVTIRPPSGTIRTNANGGGRYETSFVPIGSFHIEARESSGPDAGIASGELAENETLEVDVIFNGTGTVDGVARDFDDTPLSTGTVRLTRSAPFARDESATVASDGTFRFLGIPVGSYNLSLAVPGEVRRGTASGEIEVDGHVDAVAVKLADAGYVSGVVVKPDGATPAPNTVIELRGPSFLLTALTGVDGSFDVSGVPLGSFTLRAEDPVTLGLASAAGTLLTAGETVDVGALVLDTEPIEVESMTPTPGSVVPPDTPLVIRFTDPTNVSNVIGRYSVTSNGANVSGSWTLSSDGLEFRFEPMVGGAPAFSPWRTIDVRIDGAIADVFGRRMGAHFTAAFSTSGTVVRGTVLDGSSTVSGADVTLSAPGGGGTRVTDAFGAYRFEDVSTGPITVQAVDLSDGQGSSASVVLGTSIGLVTVDLSLAFTGSVTGHVFEFDDTPSGAGLDVVLFNTGGRLASTTTASDGSYSFVNIPVGNVTLDVTNLVTGDQGRATGWVLNQQSTTLDATMRGVGSLRLFIRDQSENVVSTASTEAVFDYLVPGKAVLTFKKLSNAAPEADGSYLFPYVLAGGIDVFASDPVSGLAGTGEGTITAGQELILDVHLQAAGSIRVTVLATDGSTPVSGADVVLRRKNDVFAMSQSTSDAEGKALFVNLPVSLGPYTVDVKLEGRVRARARDVAVAADGETAVNLALVGLGTVGGQVLPPAGETLSPSARADLTSFAAEVGGVLSDNDASDGTFLIENVPVGAFRVNARDNWNGFQGEGAGTLTADGESVVVDVQLVDNAFTFPTFGQHLVDGNEARYPVLQRGALYSAARSLIDATGGGLNLEVSVGGGPPTAFVGLATGSQEEDGRELVTASQDVDGVQVRRKIFVPRDGYFARYLEVFENPGGADVAVTATVESNLTSSSAANGDVELVATSSGDALLDPADNWVITDDEKDQDPFDGTGNGVLTTAFVLSGEATVAPSLVDFQPNGIDGVLTASYEIVVPAGGRAILLHFVSQESFRDSAAAAAERLRQLPAEALVGLGLDELGAIVNFDVPADGVSSVEPLPPLDGMVFGQLLAHDGVTRVGPATAAPALGVRFNSDQILYRRVRVLNADANGRFRFETSFSTNSHLVIPRFGFTLASMRSLGSWTTAASGASHFESRAQLNRVDGLSASATSSLNSSVTPERAVDGNEVSGWWAANGVSSATLELTLPAVLTVAVDTVRVFPSSGASLGQVQIDLLGVGGELLDSRLEPFATPNAAIAIDLSPAVSGVHRVAFHFNGNAIRVNEVEVLGATANDLGNSVKDLVFSESAGLRVEVESVGGVGLQSSIFGVSPGGLGVVNATTDSQGVHALIAPLPPAVSPVALTVTATQAAVGHPFLKATAYAQLNAGGTTLVNVVFPETTSISGQLTSWTGQPVANQSVTIFPSSGTGVSKNSDASGNFTFGYLPADTYLLRILSHGRLLYSPPIALAPPAPQVQNLQIPVFGTIDLTVLIETPAGAPALPVSAGVTAIDAGGSRNFSTNSSGKVSIANVPGGSPFTLEVRHPSNTTIVTVQTGSITSEGQVLPVTVVIPALGTVTGTVSYANGSPAASSAVELSGTGVTPKSGFANSSGAYTFTSVEGLRPLSVLARHPAANRGYIFEVGTGEIPAHAGSATVNVALPGTGTASVTVTEFDGTTPIFGATVSIVDSFSSQYRVEGTTNASGVRTVSIVPEGTFTVRAELAGEEIGTATASVPAGAVGTVVPVVVSRSSDASVEGTIFAADGLTPVPGALVRMLTPDGTTEITSRTADSAGAYRFASILPIGNSCIVRAELPGDASVTDQTTVTAATAGETLFANLSLPAKALEGNVFESDGVTPVAGVDVEAVLQGGYSEGAAVTDSQGRFTIFGVPDGSYELTATDPDGLTGFAPVTIGVSDDTVEEDVLLPAFGVVEGTVLDAAGAPPAGVSANEVALANANLREPRTTLPDAFGFYRFERVAQGAFTVVYDDPSSELSGATTSFLDSSGGAGTATNIAREYGVTATASSISSASYKADRVIDGNLNTSWFTASGDAAHLGATPYLDVIFPWEGTVTEIRMFGNRQSANGFDFFEGVFELFDAGGNVLYDSGVVSFPAPDRDVVVSIPEVSGVRRVRFTGTDDESNTPGFAELEILGELTFTNLSLEPEVTGNASSSYSGYPKTRVIDGNLSTSWFTAFGDAAHLGASPFFELVLPESAVISRLEMFGNRQSPTGYDFFAGRFELLDATGGVLFDSGVVNLPAPDRDVTLTVPDVGGVVKIRFTATNDEGNSPGFAELVVYGRYEAPEAPDPDITLPGAGSVSGQLLASGGVPTTPSGTAPVEAQSSALESRGGVVTRTGTVNGTGTYLLTGVAEGNITVSVVDTGVGQAGKTTATIQSGVETTGVDVELGTARVLPRELGLPAAERYLVQPDGSVDGELDSLGISVQLAEVSVNGKDYPEMDVAGSELSERQLVLGPVRMSGLDHTRKVFVPADGAFARFLDLFENPHAFDLEITVTHDGVVRAENLQTSSGDSALDLSDRYLAGELDTGVGLAVVYAGAGTVRRPDASATDGTSYGLTWRKLVVPAGGRIALLSFAVQADTRAAALTEAGALLDLTDPDATSGLSAAEKANIVNFIVP